MNRLQDTKLQPYLCHNASRRGERTRARGSVRLPGRRCQGIVMADPAWASVPRTPKKFISSEVTGKKRGGSFPTPATGFYTSGTGNSSRFYRPCCPDKKDSPRRRYYRCYHEPCAVSDKRPDKADHDARHQIPYSVHGCKRSIAEPAGRFPHHLPRECRFERILRRNEEAAHREQDPIGNNIWRCKDKADERHSRNGIAENSTGRRPMRSPIQPRG